MFPNNSALPSWKDNYEHNPSQSSVRCMATPHLRSLLNFVGIVVQVQSFVVHVNSKRFVRCWTYAPCPSLDVTANAPAPLSTLKSFGRSPTKGFFLEIRITKHQFINLKLTVFPSSPNSRIIQYFSCHACISPKS